MTPQSIITTARAIINDADSVLYRYSNDTLLGYVNDGMKEVSSLRPELFNTIGDLFCTAGSVEQMVTFPGAQALTGVLSIHGGAAVTPFDLDTMNQFNPNWRTDTAAPCKQWTRIAGDPLRVFIYPPAPVGQTLDVTYISPPTVLALDDTITEIPAAYETALADYVIYRAESTDDEHADSGRATSHYAAFVAKIKGT